MQVLGMVIVGAGLVLIVWTIKAATNQPSASNVAGGLANAATGIANSLSNSAASNVGTAVGTGLSSSVLTPY